MRQSRLVEALTIKEEFDGAVKSIRIRATFTDIDGPLKSTWDRTRTAADKAAFEEGCLAESYSWGGRKCERGGFDFGPAVRQAVAERQTSTSGRLMCRGRRGRWPCRISAHYMIDVTYT